MAVAYGTVAFSVRPPARAPATAVRPCAAAEGATARARADGPGKWWAPLLGWSGQPDYIDAQPAAPPATVEEEEEERPPGTKFGMLTEDKARQLRARVMETESFHDAMYHSAIASRLASAAPDGIGH